MPHFTADAIRAHIGTPQSDSDRALLAIVDLCDALRIPSGVTTEARSNAANRIEGLIVRELNVAFPIDQVERSSASSATERRTP